MAKKKKRRQRPSSDFEPFRSEPTGEALSDDEAMERVLNYHPDLKRLARAGRLPEEMTDPSGNVWSPRMHLTVHVIIEQQLANDAPSGIVALANRLEQEKKLNWHDVRHVLAAAMSEQLWYMQKELCPCDEQRYFLDIERLYQEWVRNLDN